MTDQEQQAQQFHDRFDTLERKLDALAHRLEGLLEKLERGEDGVLRDMLRPSKLNEVPHMPGLG